MSFLVGGFAVIAATALVFAYLIFIWWLDRYEREPLWMVLLTFIYGGLFGTMLGCLLSIFPSFAAIGLLGEQGGAFVSTVVVAPLAEEFTKGLVFAVLLLTRHIDNQTDGMIYGAATGLGFACVENLVYFISAADVESLVTMAVLRTLFTALVHCISSAALGMAIGWARHRPGLMLKVGAVIGGYTLAVINHAVWNGLATVSGFQSLAASGAGTVVMLVAAGLVALASIVMFALTQMSLHREHKVIRKHLAAEAERGNIPTSHVDVIPFWRRRRKSGWLKPSVPREEYLQAATLLAFRLHQLQHAEGNRREKILADIADYRANIARLLAL